MVQKILCVAEKPSIAKAVAQHLGGRYESKHVPGAKYTRNYEFEFTFNGPWGHRQVVMTSVSGHVNSDDFHPEYRNWRSCAPKDLFEAPIVTFVSEDNKPIAANITKQARFASAVFIWTDCDREGEHIGREVAELALKGNGRIEVRRARFSNIERQHIIQAAQHSVLLDENQANAVAARRELDLRIGASFTRMLTNTLKPMIAPVQELGVISYGDSGPLVSSKFRLTPTGSCQFPTLGFVVDRYFKVKNFEPETFWKIQLFEDRNNIRVSFNWKRVHLFDRAIVTVLFERCLSARIARVSQLDTRPTSKWKPLPLTTVELQKNGSRFLRMTSHKVMEVAELLYTQGFISYPRTETDQFDGDIDLRPIIQKQTSDQTWGHYAQTLLDGEFCRPRSGRNNDRAHPPIHPVNHASSQQLNYEQRRVYEFVVRRFLACCSDDAKGQTTTVELVYGPETFSAKGLIVLQRNYLDIYTYDKWESSQQLPQFTLGETFVPTEVKMGDGKTSPPGYLTEPELIALMDANGIGTDATTADHIEKIKNRCYVVMQSPNGQPANTADDSGDERATTTAGRGRGNGRGRGGARSAAPPSRARSGNAMQVLLPTQLGVALIEGYDNIGLASSLSKPYLRKEMELQMKAICDGTLSRSAVVQDSLEKYREVFGRSLGQLDVLKAAVRKYMPGTG